MRALNTIARSILLLLLLATGAPAFGQTPNTATLLVTVVDQSDANVPGARVTAVNLSNGAARDGVSGLDGSVTLPALSVNGAYNISVSKSGFADANVEAVTLRAGETATVRVKLVVSGGATEVTVYGTTQGVRDDPELGTRIDSARIDATPILGRKISSVPLLNAAFRNAKGTGDLFMNSVYVVTGAGGRREADYIVDG